MYKCIDVFILRLVVLLCLLIHCIASHIIIIILLYVCLAGYESSREVHGDEQGPLLVRPLAGRTNGCQLTASHRLFHVSRRVDRRIHLNNSGSLAANLEVINAKEKSRATRKIPSRTTMVAVVLSLLGRHKILQPEPETDRRHVCFVCHVLVELVRLRRQKQCVSN